MFSLERSGIASSFRTNKPKLNQFAAKSSIAAEFLAEEKLSSLALIVTLDGILKATAGQMCRRGLRGLRTLQDRIHKFDKLHKMNQAGCLPSYFRHLGLTLNIEKRRLQLTSTDVNLIEDNTCLQ